MGNIFCPPNNNNTNNINAKKDRNINIDINDMDNSSSSINASFSKLIKDAEAYRDLEFLSSNNNLSTTTSNMSSTSGAVSTDDDESLEDGGGTNKMKQRRSKKDKDYRGFAFCIHDKYGMLLLHCTRKKKKGPHYQVPGGHVDSEEFDKFASPTQRTWKQQRYLAARAACARELQEETSITINEERLLPVVLNKESKGKGKNKLLINEHKHRLFFVVTVTDDDFYKEEYNFEYAQNYQDCPLRLKLSIEHSAFRLEKSPSKCIQLLDKHSGGNVSMALRNALLQS